MPNTILILAILWYVVGIASFIYWWTRSYDLTLKDIPLALYVGATGPLACLIGFTLHDEGKPSGILVKRRNK